MIRFVRVGMNPDDDEDFDFTLISNANAYVQEKEFQRIAETIEKWFTIEKQILQAIEECEEKIKHYLRTKNIQYDDGKYATSMECDVLLFPLSPLVCHGIQSICYLISLLDNEQIEIAKEIDQPPSQPKINEILRKFYFSIPEDAPILTTISKEILTQMSNYLDEGLEEHMNITRNIVAFDNTLTNENIKKGIRLYIEHLSTKNTSRLIQNVAKYLSTLPYKDGYRPSVAKERKEWNNKLSELVVSSRGNEKNHPRIRLIIKNQVKEGYLNPKYKLSFDNKGKNIIYGRRVVYTLHTEEKGEAMPDFYIKEFPELPGLERASEILAKQLVGEGIPCSTIGRIDYRINDEKKKKPSRIQFGKTPKLVSVPVLISDPVGNNLSNEIENMEVMGNLDEKRFSQLIVLQTLTLVEDAKVDNFQISKNEENGKWLLHAIDNDHVFVPPIVKNKIREDVLNFKSVLFCFDEMKNQVDKDVKEQLEFLRMPSVIVKWLEELVMIDKLCVGAPNEKCTNLSSLKLFTHGENKTIQMINGIPNNSSVKLHAEKNNLEKEAVTGTIIQPCFAKDMVEDMCERIRKLQLGFKSADKLTHEAIFRDILPTVAKIYQREVAKPKSALKRFDAITDKYYNTILISSPLQKAATEVKMTKKTGVDIMKSAKVKTNRDYSPSIQLDKIINFLSEKDENSEMAKGLLKYGRGNEFKEYFEKLSIPFREKFLNTHLQHLLLEYQDPSKNKIIGDTICDVLYYMDGFTSLNLSNITSPLIYYILIRNRATLESVILKNASVPPLDAEESSLRKIRDDDLFVYSNWPLLSSEPGAAERIRKIERKASRFSLTRVIQGDSDNIHPRTEPAFQTFNFRSLYCLRKLKFIDVSGANHLRGICALLPSIRDELLFGSIEYRIDGFIEAYHDGEKDEYPLELMMSFRCHAEFS